MAGAPDQEMFETIRRDGIDLLIDLSLHTSDNRLNVFARKPAPLQLSWLGYPESSGLTAMDYRISDRHLEPPAGNKLAAPQEKAWLHPDCWTCFEPATGYPEVNPLPSAAGHPFTFGCFNNTCKINAAVLTAWSRILLATPGSRLRLLTKPGSHRKHLVDFLTGLGVEASRITFVDYQPYSATLSQGDLLGRYHEIDLALDTFPYNGTTTTCEAMWMGCPVVTRAGKTHVSRVGVSLLSAVGLQEFITDTREAYIEKAVALAGQTDRLQELRAGMRERMRQSVLMDEKRFVQGFEKALMEMATLGGLMRS